jgi:hypothetical protein
MTISNPQFLLFFALLPFIVWRLYSRMRRLIGRQRSVAWRHWVAALGFPMIILLLAGLGVLANPIAAGSLAAGLATGALLALINIRLTKFESTSEGLFYTPSPYIGFALMLFFVGRLSFRLFTLYTHGMPPPGTEMQDAGSPATMILVGLLIGYFVGYAIGVLRWRGKQAPAMQAVQG